MSTDGLSIGVLVLLVLLWLLDDVPVCAHVNMGHGTPPQDGPTVVLGNAIRGLCTQLLRGRGSRGVEFLLWRGGRTDGYRPFRPVCNVSGKVRSCSCACGVVVVVLREDTSIVIACTRVFGRPLYFSYVGPGVHIWGQVSSALASRVQ